MISRSVARLLVAAVFLLALGVASEKPLDDCIEMIRQTDSLQEFASISALKFINYFRILNEKDMSKCLNTHNKPAVDANNLKYVIELGQTRDVCNFDFITKQLGFYHESVMFGYPDHYLRRIFKYYVKKVIIRCLEVLPDKILEAGGHEDFFNSLASIKDLMNKTKSISYDESVDSKEVLYKLPSANIETLKQADQIIYYEWEKIPTVTIPYVVLRATRWATFRPTFARPSVLGVGRTPAGRLCFWANFGRLGRAWATWAHLGVRGRNLGELGRAHSALLYTESAYRERINYCNMIHHSVNPS